MKIVITEEERKRILSSHSFNGSFIKNNLKEALDKSNGIYTTETDQIIVGLLDPDRGTRVKIPAGTKVWHDYNKQDNKINIGNTIYYYDCSFKGDKDIILDNDKMNSWRNSALTTRIRETFCNGNIIKTWRELTKGSNEVTPPPGSAVDTKNPKDGLKIDGNCKTKNPYNAFVDAGLNWKVERQKWIDAKCNGTTPCILGNATTNINLRNALCDGTWPMKKDEPKTPEQPVVSPEQPAVSPEQPPVNNVVNNTATQLKQFPNLTFGVRTQ